MYGRHINASVEKPFSDSFFLSIWGLIANGLFNLTFFPLATLEILHIARPHHYSRISTLVQATPQHDLPSRVKSRPYIISRQSTHYAVAPLFTVFQDSHAVYAVS